jgi:hypothetical protein
MEKTTVSLLRAKDSSVVKLAVSAADGKFSFQSSPGKFLVSVSNIGYARRYSGIFEVSGDVEVPAIQMVKAATICRVLAFTAQKPMVEVKADKTILNVEGTINATGNDALELLRKSPGVLVDKDDNISLAVKMGCRYI